MTDVANNTYGLFIVPGIILLILLIRLAYLGMKYDDAMLKVNRNYNGYNFIRLNRRGIVIPSKLLKVTNDVNIDRHVYKYNSLLKIIWAFAVLFLVQIMWVFLNR
jgi:hypothetical protein